MNPNIFKKIIEEEIMKGAWDTLKKLYEGDENLKKVKLKSLRKKYENTQINDGEEDNWNAKVWESLESFN